MLGVSNDARFHCNDTKDRPDGILAYHAHLLTIREHVYSAADGWDNANGQVLQDQLQRKARHLHLD